MPVKPTGQPVKNYYNNFIGINQKWDVVENKIKLILFVQFLCWTNIKSETSLWFKKKQMFCAMQLQKKKLKLNKQKQKKTKKKFQQINYSVCTPETTNFFLTKCQQI